MNLAYFLIFIGFLVCCFAWYMYIRIGKGSKPLGIGLSLFLTAIAIGALFFSALILNLSPVETVGLILGIDAVAWLFVVFKEMYSEGFSSILPKKKSDTIFYIVFLLILLVILLMSLKVLFG